MKLKAVSGVMLALLLIGMLTLAFNIQPVKASGTIYIRADGSVDPPTANITSSDNVTYTLTGNIVNQSIVVERDNIVVDGADYTLQGTGTGIYLSYRSNVTICNMEIKAFNHGIWLDHSSNNGIVGNNMTANKWYVIWLYHSSNNSVVGNNITNNGSGVEIYGSSYLNIVSDNIITNNQAIGIFMYDPDGKAGWNVIKGNTIINNTDSGIGITESHGNTLEDNVIADQGQGIFFIHAANNTIKNNLIANNQKGIYLWGYDNSGNSFFHNNFMSNAHQACGEYISSNAWDDDYPSGGNYWSDHNPPDIYGGPYQNETGRDKIGDTPYVIDGNNTDRYPLIYPYGRGFNPDVNDDGKVNILDAIILAGVFGSRPGDGSWNPRCDLNQDGVVNILDAILLAWQPWC